MIDLASAVVIGISSSLAAAALFLAVLLSMRPHVAISPMVARHLSPSGQPVFLIKIVNRSRFAALRIEAELHLIEVSMTSGGMFNNSTQLDLRRSTIMKLERYSQRDVDARYAFRFASPAQIDQLWSSGEHQFLRLRVIAVHSVSGTVRVFERRYFNKTASIADGTFRFGDSFDIVPG